LTRKECPYSTSNSAATKATLLSEYRPGFTAAKFSAKIGIINMDDAKKIPKKLQLLG